MSTLSPPAAITALRLQQIAPRCDYMKVAPCLDAAAKRFGIDTPREVAHFMAICFVESQGFTRLEENLNYRAARLVQVWPKRFPTVAVANAFANNPRALANKVYGGRMGNVGPNDGWLYRGSGPAQLTGKDNFQRGGAGIGVDLVRNPDLARTWETGSLLAGWFWKANGLDRIVAADAGEALYDGLARTISHDEFDDARDARHVWNGGENGLAEVKTALLRTRGVWRG